MSGLRRVDPTVRRGPVYRAYVRLLGLRPMGWLSEKLVWRIDPLVMRLTGSRAGLGFPLPTALLETKGARSGRPRGTVVIYFHDGDRITIVASKRGLPRNPAWFHNLRAHPEVTFGGEPFRAEVVEDDGERARLWALADRVFPAYATYRDRAAAAGRTIPLVRLVPRSHPPASMKV